METRTSFHFPPFRLELSSEQLWREDQVIALRPKTFAVLRYLVEHPEKLVTKDELLDVVWAGTVVSDTVLKSCVRELRTALGDDVQNPQYIATVHRRGYRWVAADAAPVPCSRFHVSGPRTPKHQQQLGTLNFERGTYLVGREAELTQLQGCLDKALRGERQLVFVTGEAGIGKTTLVDAFLSGIGHQGTGNGEQENQKSKGKGQKAKVEEPAPSTQHLAPGVWVAWGQCIEQYGAGEAYMPILEALGRLCRELGGERLIALLHHHAPTWLVQMPALLKAADLETLQRKVQGATRERMLREMGEAINAITAEQPLVLWLEDLHWSDPSTLELLALLARRREPARLLILGTYRPVDIIVSEHPLRAVKQELQLHGHCHELAVRLLREEAIEKYLAARVQVPSPAQAGEGQGEDLSARALATLARTIHQRTEGNPLFMVNVVDSLLVQGVETRHVASLQHLEELDIGVPENLQQLIEQHLERLSAEEQRLLEVASVAGMEFSAAAVAVGAETTVDEIEQRCTALARRGQFLQSKGTTEWPDGTITTRYGFLHALYQEVTYERVPLGWRVSLHQRIGERIEAAYGERAKEIAAELAVHFERGRDYQRAVQYLQQSGENALRRSAHQEALTLLTKALALLPHLAAPSARTNWELQLQLTLGEVLTVFKGWGDAEVEQTYTRAYELCQRVDNNSHRFQTLAGLWSFYLERAMLKTAVKLASESLHLAERLQDPALVLRAHYFVGTTAFRAGDFSRAQEHLADRLILCGHPLRQPSRSVQDLEIFWFCMSALTLWCRGYADQALQKINDAFALTQRQVHPINTALVIEIATVLHALRREAQKARDQHASWMALTGQQEGLLMLGAVTFWRGWMIGEAGQGQEGIAEMQKGLAMYRASGSELGVSGCLAFLAEAYGKINHPIEGLKILTAALVAIRETKERFCEAELHRLKGELTLQQENQKAKGKGQKSKTPSTQAQEEAEACFLKAIAIAQHQQAKSWELRASTSLARLWRQQGKKKEARQILAEVYGWFTEGFDTKDLQEAKMLIEELSH